MPADIAPVRVLHLEDDVRDAARVAGWLDAAPTPFVVSGASCVRDALVALRTTRFDVVVVDLDLPDATALEALDAVRILAGGTPIVVHAAGVGPERARAAVRRGAREVLAKGGDDGSALVAAVTRASDPTSFSNDVERELRTAAAHGTPLAVCQVVVYGWAATVAGCDGEALARAVSERLAGRLGPDDGLHPLGNGGWGIVAAGRDRASADTLRDELVCALKRPIDVGADEVALRVLVGVALAPDDGRTVADMIAASTPEIADGEPEAQVAREPLKAPAAIPAAELLASVMRPAAPDPLSAEGFVAALQEAIASDQLRLHYQPIVRLGDDRIPVVEALARWEHPERGLLPPAQFIPLAEQTGAIGQLGAWALRAACRQLREWDAAGLPTTRVAVNLSARELASADLPGRVEEALRESGVAAERLELELTESMFAEPEATAQILHELRDLGVRVAIDDFGTGYSSLAYLTRFAVDAIKVDGAFVRRAADDRDGGEVVRAIVGIAHQLGLEVVAEGVETREQLAFVRDAGVDHVQGYLFSEPMDAQTCGRWLDWARERVEERDADPRASARRPGRGVIGAWRTLDRSEQVARGATLAAGAAVGAVLAAPRLSVSAGACPPGGEGRGMCVLQHGWAPAATIVFVAMAVAISVLMIVRGAPAWLKAMRDPAVRERRRGRGPAVTMDSDPLLIASSWGVRTG